MLSYLRIRKGRKNHIQNKISPQKSGRLHFLEAVYPILMPAGEVVGGEGIHQEFEVIFTFAMCSVNLHVLPELFFGDAQPYDGEGVVGMGDDERLQVGEDARHEVGRVLEAGPIVAGAVEAHFVGVPRFALSDFKGLGGDEAHEAHAGGFHSG